MTSLMPRSPVALPAYLTSMEPCGGTAVLVTDTAQALLELGHWGRGRLSATVVGITGSVGKTSTKDLARAALAAGLRTSANERSFNNDQGLPVTILNAPNDVEALVLEMGMRGFGEIRRLCEIGEPSIGVITRIAAAHTELVGGIEGVARAKGELVLALPATGTAILNGDDHRVRALALKRRAPLFAMALEQVMRCRSPMSPLIRWHEHGSRFAHHGDLPVSSLPLVASTWPPMRPQRSPSLLSVASTCKLRLPPWLALGCRHGGWRSLVLLPARL